MYYGLREGLNEKVKEQMCKLDGFVRWRLATFVQGTGSNPKTRLEEFRRTLARANLGKPAHKRVRQRYLMSLFGKKLAGSRPSLYGIDS
jgi:hypothetical protein